MRKADLERALMAVPPHPRPRPELEQVATPAGVAADLLWRAREAGDIEGRHVVDLGCGAGTLMLGAALLGAGRVQGVDIDAEAVDLARQALRGLPCPVDLEVADLAAWTPLAADTVVMNPPFGAQAGNRHGDRVFHERAAGVVRGRGGVWFLSLEATEPFLQRFVRDLRGSARKVASWDFPLRAQWGFHAAEVQTVRVGGYRATYP